MSQDEEFSMLNSSLVEQGIKPNPYPERPTPPMSGFLPCGDTVVRPSLVEVPSSPGWFRFPEPWNTEACRITMDGISDLEPVGYSYWRSINAHMGSDRLLVLLTHYRDKGGPGPSIYEIDKRGGKPRCLGALFEPDEPMSYSTGEGWFWSAMHPHLLYIPFGNKLYKTNVGQSGLDVVFEVPEHQYIWQVHCSFDETIFSCTLRDKASFEMLGALIYDDISKATYFYPKIGEFDECQVDRSGRWLVIKENVDSEFGEDNRIIDLGTNEERVIHDQRGAAGHSDCGRGYIVGEDNFAPQPSALKAYALDTLEQKLLYHSTSWQGGLGHVSHTNWVGDYVVVSNGYYQLYPDVPRANEIIQVPLDGSLTFRPLAPNLSTYGQIEGRDFYRHLPKANLCPAGKYAIWTCNLGGENLHAFLVKV